MYNLLISIGVGVAVTALIGGFFGSVWYGLIPGIIGFGVAYVILARRTMKQVQAVSQRAQQHFQAQNIDRGIEVLEADAYPLSKWQFFVEAQIRAQIGRILYMARRFDDAEHHLREGFKKDWVARGMLGALYYKRGKHDEMKKVFEEAVAGNKKKSLLWNLYAYCLWKSGDRDEAIDVLNRALDKMGDDKNTEKNLNRLKNGRSMKMRRWNNQWYQFHLDAPPAQRHQPQFRRF